MRKENETCFRCLRSGICRKCCTWGRGKGSKLRRRWGDLKDWEIAETWQNNGCVQVQIEEIQSGSVCITLNLAAVRARVKIWESTFVAIHQLPNGVRIHLIRKRWSSGELTQLCGFPCSLKHKATVVDDNACKICACRAVSHRVCVLHIIIGFKYYWLSDSHEELVAEQWLKIMLSEVIGVLGK